MWTQTCRQTLHILSLGILRNPLPTRWQKTMALAPCTYPLGTKLFCCRRLCCCFLLQASVVWSTQWLNLFLSRKGRTLRMISHVHIWCNVASEGRKHVAKNWSPTRRKLVSPFWAPGSGHHRERSWKTPLALLMTTNMSIQTSSLLKEPFSVKLKKERHRPDQIPWANRNRRGPGCLTAEQMTMIIHDSQTSTRSQTPMQYLETWTITDPTSIFWLCWRSSSQRCRTGKKIMLLSFSSCCFWRIAWISFRWASADFAGVHSFPSEPRLNRNGPHMLSQNTPKQSKPG